MNKFIAISALMAAFVSANALAADANLTFNGAVSTGTCTMNAADATKTLVIPDVSSSSLANAGNTAFTSYSANSTISFTGCPAEVSNVVLSSASGTGTTFGGDTSRQTPASGTATGVHLVISSGPRVVDYLRPGVARSFPVSPSGTVKVPVYVGVTADITSSSAFAAPTAGNYSSSYTLTFSYS